jgi:hypothetical protein
VTPFFQVGILVHDLEAAMDELSRGIGVRWGAIRERERDGLTYRLVFSVEGPPHIELIEGSPGTPWDTVEPRIDHLMWWSDDLAGDTRRLEREGLPLDAGDPIGGDTWGYFKAEQSGLRIELIDSATRADYRQRWQIGDSAGDADP